MARAVPILKFVGTVSLGLLTGLSYALSSTTLPTLLSLPSASHALPAFLTLQARAKRRIRLFTSTAIASLYLAYLIAPSSGRHPYLVWTSLIAEQEASGSPTPAEKSWVDLEKGEDVNGEVVRGNMERFGFAEAVRTGVMGTAFAMAIVGIWGDGA
ncbi:hypothetical protein K490DRAFT_47089 [Saccharata proteae CBS 121410]|uniref:Uncharacterized protein n=1 Tax=Saccharata proteae CBS 121410 TaxID=1314787 RepID=A0A9P4HSP8_9PEZI|nr:hypothetical protein K490DRAFT_47089 [Saccharata proteae CBS 121410]